MDEGDVRHNVGNWVNFLKSCEDGEQAAVTVVQFLPGEAGYNYVKYDATANSRVQMDEDYSSHNTRLLNVDETIAKILTTEYVQNEYNSIKK